MDISEFNRLHTTSHYSRHPWEIARGKALVSLIRGNIPGRPAALVDVGSGDAYITNLLQGQKMADAFFAIDNAYTPDIIGSLQKNNDDSPVGYYISIEKFQESHPRVDKALYLCMDVLEHLKEEGEVLDLIARKPIPIANVDPISNVVPVDPAYYFFTVPAFQSVFSNHDTLLGHYRRYTVGRFEKVLTDKGLTVISSGYFFFSLLLLRWFEKKMLRKKDYSIDNWKGGPLKTKILTSILFVDFKIGDLLKKCGIRLPGLSCYCICKAS